MMPGGVRNDGPLRVAEKGPVVLSALLPSENLCWGISSASTAKCGSEVTDEDTSPGNGTPAGEWSQRWQAYLGSVRSPRPSHGHVGILGWEAKAGGLFYPSAATHTLPDLGSTASASPSRESAVSRHGSLVTQVFWPRVIPSLVPVSSTETQISHIKVKLYFSSCCSIGNLTKLEVTEFNQYIFEC